MNIEVINKLQQLKDEMIKEQNIDNKLIKNNDKLINERSKNIYNIEEHQRIIKESQRKELWYVDFGQRKGSLQNGIRPALIDSNDINNKYSNIRNVYPLTSQMTKANIPVHIEIEGYGLKEKSIILIEQGTPIDIRFQLKEYIGTVDDLVMQKVKRARDIQHGEIKQKTTFERLSHEQQQYVIDKLNIIKDCNTVLDFLKKRNGSKKDIDLAEDEKFYTENKLMTFCYNNNIKPDEFYSAEKGINEEFRDKIAL